MKVTFVLLFAALFYVHVARGKPAETKENAQNPQADHAQAPQSQQAAPAAEKPETCKANVNGTEQTFVTGDRYCLDATTHRVCNYGEWIDGTCPDNSKCLKSPTSWRVLCRLERRNQPQPPHPQNDNAQAPQSDNAKSPSSNPAPESSPSNPAPPPQQPQESSTTTTTTTATTPTTTTTTQQPQPPPPPPSNPAPAPSNPAPAPSNPDLPPPPPPKAENNPAPPKPETCKATVNGQEQTLQPGDRYCLDDNTNRVCNWGEFVDFQCPSGSKCLKSPTQWQVLCRVDNTKQSATGQSASKGNQ